MASLTYLDVAITSKSRDLDLGFAKFSCNFNLSEKYHNLHHSDFPANYIVDLLIAFSKQSTKDNHSILTALQQLSFKPVKNLGSTSKHSTESLTYLVTLLEQQNDKINKLEKQVKKLENLPFELTEIVNSIIGKQINKISRPVIEENKKLQNLSQETLKAIAKHTKLLLGDSNWDK